MLNLTLSGTLKDSFCSVKELISFCRVSFGFWNSRDVSAQVFRCNDEKKNVSSSLWSWKSKILCHILEYLADDPRTDDLNDLNDLVRIVPYDLKMNSLKLTIDNEKDPFIGTLSFQKRTI